MTFYQRAADNASRLISLRGRDVTYVAAEAVADLVDPARPWKGYAPPTVPDPTRTTVFKTVVISPNQVRIFGLSALGDSTMFDDLIRKSEKILVFAPGSFDVESVVQVIDDGETYGVIASQVLKPGDTVLLAYMGIRR